MLLLLLLLLFVKFQRLLLWQESLFACNLRQFGFTTDIPSLSSKVSSSL